MIGRVISGGQTGVDRGALDAAGDLGIAHGGSCPRDRRAEDGRVPDRYDLVELATTSYPERTRRNVADADATLILTPERRPSGGTKLTAEIAHSSGKPWLAADPTRPEHVRRVVEWLASTMPATLNVAGPRESRFPGIAQRTREFMRIVLGEVAILDRGHPTQAG